MCAQFWLSGSQQDSKKVQHKLKQLTATGVPKGGQAQRADHEASITLIEAPAILYIVHAYIPIRQ